MKTWTLMVIVGLFLSGYGSAYADYLPLRTDVPSEEPQIRVMRCSATQVQFEVTISGVEISRANLLGRNWDRVEIAGGGVSSTLGAPELATYSRLVAIPPTAAVHADMEVLESETIPNIELMPAQGKDPEDFVQDRPPFHFDQAAYSTDGYFGQDEVTIAEPVLWRGVRLVSVMTTPTSYNPVSKELRVAHRYRVNVHFEGYDPHNLQIRPIRPMSHAWAKLMRSQIANFDDLGIDEIPAGSYLIICLNNPDLLNRIAPLVDWKKCKGHSVTVATCAAGATTTDIKSLIQNAYNTWEIPPEYVLLFGDTSGDYALAAWETYQIDHPYSQLDGDDILADVAIGRLPAASPAMADMMVNKQLRYEKTPFVVYPNWYRQGLLVSGSYYSGISPVQVGRWIKARFVEHGYTRIDTLWYTTSSLDPNFVVNSINDGMSYFNYRGWVGMGGFGNGNIDQLSNGAMLPFVTIPTCGTGGFSGDSNMKHFVSVGTVSTPKGAIGAVGTATTSTHTRFNNTLAIGIYAGLFDEGITQEGTALNRGKVELYNAYGQNDLTDVINFSKWNALAGDPGCDLFTGPIRFMNCTIPDLVVFGVNTMDLTVTEPSVGPLPGATVCLYKPNETQYVGETDSQGHITLPINVTTTGGVKVTITRQGFYPIVDSTSVVQTEVVVGYLSNTIDDDNSGTSSGDGDGIINPGETVELPLVYKNFGFSTTATNVITTATENDTYTTLIDNSETFPNIAPGRTANSLDDFDLSVAPECPNGHVIHLALSNHADQGTWVGGMDLSVVSYRMQFQSYYATGMDTLLSPGEVAGVILRVKNTGNKTAAGLSATCNSLSPYVTVVDTSAFFGTINIGSIGNCDTNPFGMSVSPNIPPGTEAKIRIVYTNVTSAAQIDTISIQIGTKTQVDPQGPDAYGYYCFDNTDVNYPEHPLYNWIEISTIGSQLPIEDPAENQDQSINVNLPFTFRYYNEAVNVITVCSNGWIATNSNPSFNDFRNYPIPGAPGPSGMIAPFWDDLITNLGGHVYSFYDAANRRFIVEWYHMPNFGNTSVLETFQVILYDPAYTPTPTGDGEIVFQYNTIGEVNGMGDDNPYSTIGIESPDQQDGIQVVYWNTYNDVAAAHVQNQRAYKFTTSNDYINPNQPLEITTSPTSPGVIIPANGGSFQYNISVHNLTTQTQIFSVWNKVRNQANVYTNVFGPITRSLPGGANPSRVLTQTIAGSISSGTLYFISYLGSYPYGIVDSSYFIITKLATRDGGSWINESFVTGDLFSEYQVGVETILPDQFTLDQNYPNPFNPLTTLNFSLPEKARVKLEIYNIAGRRVATLIDNWREAGNHQVTWDASGEPSGVYLVRMDTGKFRAAEKIVLLK